MVIINSLYVYIYYYYPNIRKFIKKMIFLSCYIYQNELNIKTHEECTNCIKI
jgi:hypothetical protein